MENTNFKYFVKNKLSPEENFFCVVNASSQDLALGVVLDGIMLSNDDGDLANYEVYQRII